MAFVGNDGRGGLVARGIDSDPAASQEPNYKAHPDFDAKRVAKNQAAFAALAQERPEFGAIVAIRAIVDAMERAVQTGDVVAMKRAFKRHELDYATSHPRRGLSALHDLLLQVDRGTEAAVYDEFRTEAKAEAERLAAEAAEKARLEAEQAERARILSLFRDNPEQLRALLGDAPASDAKPKKARREGLGVA